jgi:hypothetical protein
VVVVQLAAWLAATHLQSRFLLPTVVPGAVLVACAVTSLPILRHSAILAIALLAWSAQPALAFLRDGPDPRAAALWIGAAQDLAGLSRTDAAAEASADRAGTPDSRPSSPPSNLVQAINALDPASARIAAVGLSAT